MQSLLDGVHPEWKQALQPVRSELVRLTRALDEEQRHQGHVLPAPEHIMRAFHTPLSAVKVLIVGQDPYPTPGHAMGLAFSVAAGVKPPRSLTNIFSELTADVGCQPPSSGDLSGWAQQGVMLLNRVLTVRAGRAGSHRGIGWEQVTDCAIAALVARQQALVAILWGRDAQSLEPALGTTVCISSPHPSPLSAAQGFFGSRPFSRANTALCSQGADGVNWCLR